MKISQEKHVIDGDIERRMNELGWQTERHDFLGPSAKKGTINKKPFILVLRSITFLRSIYVLAIILGKSLHWRIKHLPFHH